ncbi:MAG: UDP-N-acetylmuramoyl-tripeptide--D-alanyl-D-alanine ligase, partial [Candidatus Spechtbacterales bacterium]
EARTKRASLEGVLTIGITGSYGKTSMKEYVATILSQKFKVLKTEANNNTEIGIANTILHRLDENYDVFVAEMGAYRKGEIARSAAMVKPAIAVLTGIGPQHLSLFGSMQNIQEAKYELIESLPEKGLAIFNGDDDHARSLFRQCKNPKRIYTTDPLADPTIAGIRAESIRFIEGGMEIHIKDGKETEVITTSLLGRHNATNLLGAISVARALGMDYEEIQAGIKTIQPIPHTLQIVRGIKETTVIDDSYSGNVRGVFAALEVLSRMKARRKILVLQPLIELGGAAEKAHKEIGAKIGEICDYCIVVAPDYYTSLSREALSAGMSKTSIMCIPDAHHALRKIQELSDKGDVILLENRVGDEILRGVIAQGSVEGDTL